MYIKHVYIHIWLRTLSLFLSINLALSASRIHAQQLDRRKGSSCIINEHKLTHALAHSRTYAISHAQSLFFCLFLCLSETHTSLIVERESSRISRIRTSRHSHIHSHTYAQTQTHTQSLSFSVALSRTHTHPLDRRRRKQQLMPRSRQTHPHPPTGRNSKNLAGC